MGYDSMSFLDTKEEHKEWHRGGYRGLKIVNPLKLWRSLKVYDCGVSEWWRNDRHYHDMAMLGAYFGRNAALAGGAYLAAVTGLPLL
jgi:hypothetical protein